MCENSSQFPGNAYLVRLSFPSIIFGWRGPSPSYPQILIFFSSHCPPSPFLHSPFPFSPFTLSPFPLPHFLNPPFPNPSPPPSDIQTPHNNPSETVMQERTLGCFPPLPKGADLIFPHHPHHTPPPNPPPKNQASHFFHHLVTFLLFFPNPDSSPFSLV